MTNRIEKVFLPAILNNAKKPVSVDFSDTLTAPRSRATIKYAANSQAHLTRCYNFKHRQARTSFQKKASPTLGSQSQNHAKSDAPLNGNDLTWLGS